MRALFEKLELEDLPQNRKRVALVERALQSGVVARDSAATFSPPGTGLDAYAIGVRARCAHTPR